MSRGPWLGRWFKLYDNFDDPKFWTSKIDNEELGAWLRLLSLGSRCIPKGQLYASYGVPFSRNQVEMIIKDKGTVLDKWYKQGSIKLINGVINIVNWGMYQNEEDRKKLNRPPKSPPINRPPKSLHKEVEVEFEVNEDIKKHKDNPLSPIGEPDGNPTKELVLLFASKIKDRFNTEYVIDWGKDMSLMKSLLKTVERPKLEKAMDKFLDSPNWADQHTIGIFKKEINKILQHLSVGGVASKIKYMGEVL